MSKFVINHFNSWFIPDRKFDNPVNLYIDNFKIPDSNGINIALLCEPESIIPKKDFFIKNKEKYDVILTFNTEVLEKCSNAELFEFGSCWIQNQEETTEKKFEVSFLVGGKSTTEGHKLRHKIWDNQSLLKIPKNFFNSSQMPYLSNTNNNFLGNKKEPLFTSKYHICVENSREENYFSEKIIDCLYTKTIPIYWGCPNIEKWFDTNSIIIVNSFQEIVELTNNLTENLYDEKIKSVEKNFEKCKPFLNFHKRLNEKIETIVKKYT